MAAAQQIRLLLWKDYLIRKRKPITLAGIIWATCVMLSLYIVRINIDNTDYPTCQFAARALPSAGVLPFLQSFICNVNNDCSPMDQYEDIPTYENARFTQLQRQISPLIYNDSVMTVAASVPDALKLLATMSDIADNPTFLDITKRGLLVKDLFRDSKRVKRYLISHLDIPEYVANSVMSSELRFDGLFKGNMDRCDVDSMRQLLNMTEKSLATFVTKICAVPQNTFQNVIMDLVLEMDLGKYIKMAGDMYLKLSGDDRISKLGDMVAGGLRMMSLDSFLPVELSALLGHDADFSYVNLTMITKVLEVFKPTFGESETFKSLQDFSDTAIQIMQYFHKVFAKENEDNEEANAIATVDNKSENISQLRKIKQVFNKLVNSLSDVKANNGSLDVFKMFSKIMNFGTKWLPGDLKHEVLFYSTLLAKLIEAGQKLIIINMNLEQWLYNVSLRNPEGVKVLLGLPPAIVGKGLEALADAERTQIMTSKMDDPSEMFCDCNRIEKFFVVSPDEAAQLQGQLCSAAWKKFTADLVSSFGIPDVKDNINNMASLFILEALGRDISSKLYSIDKDFEIVKNFTDVLVKMDTTPKPTLNWRSILDVPDDSEFMRIVRERSSLAKHMLITVHGAFAKEVVKQNPLLEYKTSPFLKNVLIIVEALNDQLGLVPRETTKKARDMYPQIIQTVLATAMDEEKTYKSLSTPCEEIFCRGVSNASEYLIFPPNVDQERLFDALCDVSAAIEAGLMKDSVMGKAIQTIRSVKHDALEELDWTKLITELNSLYETLHRDYTYLFEYRSFGMDEELQKQVSIKLKEAGEFWFSLRRLDRVLHVVLKFAFRLMDILDRDIFGLTNEVWLKIKYSLNGISGPLLIVHDFTKLIANILRAGDDPSSVPPATVSVLWDVVPRIPALIVDGVNLMTNEDVDVAPITGILNASPPWPCSATSLTQLLPFSEDAQPAVRALEALLCFNGTFQSQWKTYLTANNVKSLNMKFWNTTVFPPHVFLKFSSAFDFVVVDLDIIKEISTNITVNEDKSVTLMSAIEYAIEVFNTTNRETLRKFFSKLDTVLNAIDTSTTPDDINLNKLYTDYFACSDGRPLDECRDLSRAASKYTLHFLSVTVANVAEDLFTYLKEANEPDATFLQLAGFTRNTALYLLYERLPDFVAVLINSYWDLGFMNQVRRASLAHFWDCDEVLSALNPGPGSPIDKAAIDRVQPLVCPSLFFWLSMPRGQNALLDVITKPQYFFFTMNVTNFKSDYEKAFIKTNELSDFVKTLSIDTNKTKIDLNVLRKKLEETVNTVLSYKINISDPSYILFNEISKKEFVSSIYLTRIVTIVNKLVTNLNNLNITNIASNFTEEESKSLDNEISTLRKSFVRRPTEVIALHFDLITDVLWKSDGDYKITNALVTACVNLKSKNDKQKILVENDRVTAQICGKKYEIIYNAIADINEEDYEKAKGSLVNLVSTLAKKEEITTDIFEFLNEREEILKIWKRSIKYASDLELPIYLKYLHNNIRHHAVLLSFLSGEDWWGQLRELYNGPKAKEFLDAAENVFDMAEDILLHLDRVHLVKLIRDVDVNSSDASLCRANLSLAEYVPGAALGALARRACAAAPHDLAEEVTPLLFASQGYNNDLKLSPELDYTVISSDIDKVESKLELIKQGPKSPMTPSWITEEKVARFKDAADQLLSTESLIRISFGALSNVVDAGTLFLNSSQCTLCSQFTSWFKQLSLQLYKKQEYDALLCQIDLLSLDDVYHTLKNDFHWDMAISELISTRNYTKFELNKSMNEFLELVKQHVLEDLSRTTKMAECLAHNVTRSAFGNVTLFAKIVARTGKLLRAELPHLREVAGVAQLPFMERLFADVAHNLLVTDHLTNYVNDTFSAALKKVVADKDVVSAIEHASIKLNAFLNTDGMDKYLLIKQYSWNDICEKYDCKELADVIDKNINKTLINKNLPELQHREFWEFSFISNIIGNIGDILDHLARILGVLSQVDFQGVMDGKLVSLVDTGMQILTDEAVDSLLYSIAGLLEDMHVVLRGTPLDRDAAALAAGLAVLRDYKNYIIKEDVRVPLSRLFAGPEAIEIALGRLGINNTNFWSVAAPRLRTAHILLKPIFASKQSPFHIETFVCQPESMALALALGDAGPVSAEDVCGAVAEQFCGLQDQRAKRVLAALAENINYTYVLDELKSHLLSKLFKASNLSEAEGDRTLEQMGRMAELVPLVRARLGGVSDALAGEPLLMKLRRGGSIAEIATTPGLLSDVGSLMCGKPFNTDIGRIYRSVVAAPDLSARPDELQLQALPTDFCRSLYKQITSIQGGKIVWSFAKPLLAGKILYTPPSPIVRRIIQKANESFAPMLKLVDIIHAFAHTVPALGQLDVHRAGLLGLQKLMMAPQFEDLRTMLMGDGKMPDVNVTGFFEDFGDIESIGGLVKTASDMLRCVDLNRFRAATSERALAAEAARLTRVKDFSAGLVFMNISEKQTELPVHIEYKIRMDIENAPTTTRLKNYFWTPGPESNFLENMRYFRGFIQVQDVIDKAIIQVSRDSSRAIQKRDVHQDKEPLDWSIYTQQMPYPCYRKDSFQTSVYESQAVVVAFFFSLLLTVSSIVRFIVSDKESGNTMLMSVMGVRAGRQSLSWAAWSLAELVVTAAAVTTVLTAGRVLPHTEPSFLLALLLLYSCSVLSFCYMMSKLYQSASFAAVCTGVAYLITFMPFVLILSLEAVLTRGLKIIVSLSMSSSLCYSLLTVTRWEAQGARVGWAQLWASPLDADDMNIAVAATMMALDTLIYFVVGLLLERFFGIKTENNITNCKATGEKAGVSIVNISKAYGRKLALDNVSMELHKGQITTLLGHNGAGKTTLTKILTGMLKPTKGHVIVRSEDGTRSSLGVCPQRDVLFECMSAREHIALYAQLKSGLPLEKVQEDIDGMLRVLSLGPVSEEPAARLSGGTRRRLCVALAFVARPHLVSLDEPTAGVDPAARRDIWSMIMKLRENRTILLTTHHLDEAELLSDQIVIMHKGQIHTTGSPIDIRRSLGSGYKLAVTYPAGRGAAPGDATDADEDYIEEKTKTLLAVARGVVKNANLVDVNGQEVEISLPFYDSDGVSNNFLQLCETLETKQSELDFESYNMDCSSLEQVFFSICQQVDAPHAQIDYGSGTISDTSSKSASTSSVRAERAPLAPAAGPRRGTSWDQFLALLHLRYLHYSRNRWLLFLLIILPSLFVTVAMGFSTIRPPADNEVALKLTPDLYEGSTQFMVPTPIVHSKEPDPSFAQVVLDNLRLGKESRNWTSKDSPVCQCTDVNQHCDIEGSWDRPQMMLLPDEGTLNNWLVDSHQIYIEKRYGGFTAVVKNNVTHLVAWYNNKGHHALPAVVGALNSAALRAASGRAAAAISAYTHPLKISKEQINKDTVYQHIADAGISVMLLLGYSLVSAGAAIYLVTGRCSGEKRLTRLCGVSPALACGAALLWDLGVIVVNIAVTAVVLELFHFPVFVARNNLPAICLLIFLYGYACAGVVHIAERAFREPSLANMLLFCGNAFVGFTGVALLLILDIISDSDATDNARWVLHKILLLSPQFVLGDGLLEIAKNTIQSQVLATFGMDTYRDPLHSSLLLYHYIALVCVGTVLILINLAIEYDYFDAIVARFGPRYAPRPQEEEPEVAAEAARVRAALEPLRLRTIGNINAGYIQTELDSIRSAKSPERWAGAAGGDAAACVRLTRVFRTNARPRVAVRDLTLGVPRGQCTALLGENGAGKSTTFAMLTGQLRPTAGHVYLDNRRVTSTELCQGLISYCPQTDAIDPLVTVRETLEYYCKLRGISDANEVIKRTTDMFDLKKYIDIRSGTLSGGNKRKLCAAIAFMGSTPLILLDEPTSGMDPGSRAGVWRALDVAAAEARGVLLTTHALGDARRAAARVALLRDGRLCALAPLRRCLERFGGGYVCACRVRRGAAAGAWARVRAAAPAAQLTVLHHAALHFLLPAEAVVDGKPARSSLRDVFRLLAALQAAGHVEDFTVNRSSLDQMFLSFNNKKSIMDPEDLPPAPSPRPSRRNSEELDSVTAL